MKELGPRVDFHIHTTASDGKLLPAAIAYEAAAKGHAAIAITDHVDASNLEEVTSGIVKFVKDQQASLPLTVIPGVELSYLDPQLLEKYARRARELGAKLVIVHGETLAELAVPKGTNHAALKLKGLVDILAHPGPLTEEDAILAKVNDIYLELSAKEGHSRGNRHVAKLARQFKAKLLVNTDSHSEKDLITQKEAYLLAKKAGLTKSEAVKALRDNPQELLKKIGSR